MKTENQKGPKVTVSSKNQIVIPAEAREKLGIKPGDKLIVDISEHHMILFKEPENYADFMYGLYKEVWEGINTDEYINNERDSWNQ